MSNVSKFCNILKSYHDNRTKQYVDYQNTLTQIEPFRGSSVYEGYLKENRENYQAAIKGSFNAAKKDLLSVLKDMRKSAQRNLVKQPTADMVNTLNLLKMTDSLSPGELTLYADQMKDCPLALKVLSDIGRKNGMIIGDVSSTQQLDRINALENAAYIYLSQYDPEAVHNGQALPSIRAIEQMFVDKQPYGFGSEGITDQGIDAFLYHFTRSTDRDGYELNAPTKVPTVQYRFDDVRDMMAHITKTCVGMTDDERVTVIDNILAHCPANYKTAYNLYKDQGIEEPLINEDMEGQK